MNANERSVCIAAWVVCGIAALLLQSAVPLILAAIITLFLS